MNYKNLKALRDHASLEIGVAFECALDNAGLDGLHLEHLTPEQLAEALYHVELLLDGNGTNMPEADLAIARAVFCAV